MIQLCLKNRKVLLVVVLACLLTMLLIRKYEFQPDTEKTVISKKETTPLRKDYRENKNSSTIKDPYSDLTEALRLKIKDAKSTRNLKVPSTTCKEMGIVNYQEKDCSNNKDECLRTSIPEDPAARIRELKTLKYLSISEKVSEVVQEMRNQVKGHYEFLILTGFSWNHYGEAQAQIKNYHQVVYPSLNKNFSMIIYDLGLSKSQRTNLEKHCRCTVISFPFDRLPDHFRNLRCFAWKPVILAAHIEQAEVVFWGDTSVRIRNGSAINTMIERTKIRGVQQQSQIYNRNAWHTSPLVFEAFGDSPCIHFPFGQVAGGFLFYHREPLIQQTVIEPLLACASNASCICPANQHQDCKKVPPKTIGVCNRFDQSVMTLVLSRLFREKYYHFAVDMRWFASVLRGNKTEYFKELEQKASEGLSTAIKIQLPNKAKNITKITQGNTQSLKNPG